MFFSCNILGGSRDLAEAVLFACLLLVKGMHCLIK